MFALILDKFYDGIYTEGSLNVDSFDKSLLFSISFTMEGLSSVIARKFANLPPQIFTLKFSLIN